MVDDAGSTWCTSGTCDIATCCQDFVAAPEYITLPEGFPKYVYADADEAHAACQAKHPVTIRSGKFIDFWLYHAWNYSYQLGI